MRNKIRYICYIIIIGIMIMLLNNIRLLNVNNKVGLSENTSTDWNNGYCIDDGSRLIYSSCGSMYHYICPECGRELIFNKIQNYN